MITLLRERLAKVPRSDWLIGGSLLALPFVFYLPLFLPGEARQYFEGGDFVDQFYAFAVHEVRTFAAGGIPLWNPYAYGGTPFWADIQSAVAYPPSLAVALPSALLLGRLPFLLLEAEAVAHFSLAGIFTYLFARHELGSRRGALLTALAFTFGGYLTGYPPLQLAVLEASVWLPLCLLGIARTLGTGDAERLIALRGRQVPLPSLVLPVALGMALLAGHPQTGMYCLYAGAAYAAWNAWPWRHRGWRRWQRLAIGVTLGLGLSAAGWLPATEFLRLSNRAAGDYAALSHGFPPRELVGVLLAGITKWSPLYVGVLPLILAAMAGWLALATGGPAARRLRLWIGIGLVATVLSLGANAFAFDAAYALVPGFDLFRGQERAAFLVSFSLAMLAGAGFTAWLACSGSGQPLGAGTLVSGGGSRLGQAIANGALLLAGAGFVLLVVAEPDWRLPPLRLLLIAGATVLIAAVRRTRWLSERYWVAAVLALVLADLYSAGAGTNLVAIRPAELEQTAVVEAMAQGGTQRVRNDYRLPANAGVLPPNFGVLHEIESTSGASPLRLRTYESLRDGLANGNDMRLHDLLGVSDLLLRGEEPDLPTTLIASDGEGPNEVTLHRLKAPAPLVWRATSALVAADDAQALELLSSEDLNPLSTVVLHQPPETHVAAAGEYGGVGEVDRSAGRVLATTTGDGPAWIVFSEMYYPGWRAYVDWQPAHIYRADVALMAVEVPSGDHEVLLEFRSPLVAFGLLATLLSAGILAAAWWRLATDDR